MSCFYNSHTVAQCPIFIFVKVPRGRYNLEILKLGHVDILEVELTFFHVYFVAYFTLSLHSSL